MSEQEQRIGVDPNRVIAKLTDRLTSALRENAMLEVIAEQAQERAVDLERQVSLLKEQIEKG